MWLFLFSRSYASLSLCFFSLYPPSFPLLCPSLSLSSSDDRNDYTRYSITSCAQYFPSAAVFPRGYCRSRLGFMMAPWLYLASESMEAGNAMGKRQESGRKRAENENAGVRCVALRCVSIAMRVVVSRCVAETTLKQHRRALSLLVGPTIWSKVRSPYNRINDGAATFRSPPARPTGERATDRHLDRRHLRNDDDDGELRPIVALPPFDLRDVNTRRIPPCLRVDIADAAAGIHSVRDYLADTRYRVANNTWTPTMATASETVGRISAPSEMRS